MERVTKKKPTINHEGYDMLVKHILRTSNPSPTLEHDQRVWDDCKRHILACIEQQFIVQ